MEWVTSMGAKVRVPRETLREFGIRLKQARVAAGFRTTADLALLLDLEAKTYRRYERGEVFPDIVALIKILELTGYSLDWLIAGYGPGPSRLRLPSGNSS
jgi:transcriptional regulator with XRE-family HTH domain